MAGSLNEIKEKIISTQKTSHITGAMQMVSAAKLTKSEQTAQDFQIYASKNSTNYYGFIEIRTY